MQPCASVILPLALSGSYTYAIPQELAGRVVVGSRVVVQFGAKHYYTGIVVRLHDDNPLPDMELKSITDIADPEPIILPSQLKFWSWISSYYMCRIGDIMKAGLPAGLKLESETTLVRNEEFDADEAELTERERAILTVLPTDKGYNLLALEKELRVANLMQPVRHLMEMGAIHVYEKLAEGFKPRTETYVRLCEPYGDQEQLNRAFNEMSRAQAQTNLLLQYLNLSAAGAAFHLHNLNLLKPVKKSELCTDSNKSTALTALRKRGILETYAVEVERLKSYIPASDDEGTRKLRAPKPLAEQQQRAFDEVKEVFQQKNVCLLHGVTSSGKTEVYIHLIEEMLAQGKQVLYLLPEIALTTQITTRLGHIFGDRMGVYHSKFPDNERVELWKHQLSDQPYPLILGVRSSIFLPFQNLGLIIVDEEHETSYKQQDPAPRYGARDAAIVLAQLSGAKTLLGTATPSLESYHNAIIGKYGLVEMMHRFGDARLPEIKVEDVKELKRKKLMTTPFTPLLTREVRQTLEQGEQAILFHNRRGYSPVLECDECGWTPRCTRCDVSLTLHQRIGKLVCHYCGATYNIPPKCPCCGNTRLKDIGYGTEKIESSAESIFPDARTERMDLDTTRSRTSYEKIIHRFQTGETNLLIGTQMVTKGLDFDKVRVVGILNADQMLNLPDFRAYERAFQMLSQVAGRAGRRGKDGLVVLQTKQPDCPVIHQVVTNDYKAMYDDQIEERRDFHFPPFYRLIDIYLKHRQEEVVEHAAKDLGRMLQPYFGMDLLGPDRPLVSRIQLLHIRKLIVKVRPGLSAQSVRQTLTAAREHLLRQAPYKSVNVYFDVDP